MEQNITPGVNRRRFIEGAAATAAVASVSVATTADAQGRSKQESTGTLKDVKHVVILMQENRSFDHYYGTMKGVRGFGDRAAITQPDGSSIFKQPTVRNADGYLYPFHVDTTKYDGQDLGDVDHGWTSGHAAWAQGDGDNWPDGKENDLTMAHFEEQDIPYHFALAKAFTICDNYFCSIKGPTTPNRLYHWSGSNGPVGHKNAPEINNPADYKPVFDWQTYPEALQDKGINWRLYANKEVGDGDGADGWVGDYGDNPLWLFDAYHDPKNKDLADRASVFSGNWQANQGKGYDPAHVLADFIADADAGTLPEVSWIVGPYAYSEHPEARPVDGAVYIDTVMKTLWRNEELWKNTVVFINYDENDGYFDHVVTPTPPATETDEYIGGQPIGYGNRVPLTVISPFSRGGWVNSQVADHTSILRFLETWTGVQAPNITKWRRKISSDLLSCFDFANPDYSIPTLPDAFNLRNQADRTQTQLPTAKAPAAGAQVAPIQEPGVLKARALPYQPTASLAVSGLVATLRMANAGTAAVNLQVNHRKIPLSGKWFDVDNTAEVAAAIPVSDAAYGISVHGPNGFLRTFAGAPTTGLTVKDSIREGGKPRLEFELTNTSTQPLHVVLTENRPGQGDKAHRTVAVGATIRHEWASHYFENNWYDVVVTVVEDSTFIHRFAGHLENGNPSFSG